MCLYQVNLLLNTFCVANIFTWSELMISVIADLTDYNKRQCFWFMQIIFLEKSQKKFVSLLLFDIIPLHDKTICL